MTVTIRLTRTVHYAAGFAETSVYELSDDGPYNPSVVRDLRDNIVRLAAEDAAAQDVDDDEAAEDDVWAEDGDE